MGRKKGAAYNLEEQILHKVEKVFGDGARVISHNPGSVSEQGLLTGKTTLILNQVLKYQQRGFSVIPIQPKEKKPLVAWEPYQTDRASEETLTQWFTSWPDANVGIVTGAISDLVVIDCDSKDATRELKNIVSELKPIPRVKTGHGWHFFFKHPGKSVLNRVGVLPKMDVRGDGGYVVAPPSVHSSGKRYEWQISLNGELPLCRKIFST
jgi:Bifunctional DNA primase/polymerase, N-terminal